MAVEESGLPSRNTITAHLKLGYLTFVMSGLVTETS
jgi:hypothetical protein